MKILHISDTHGHHEKLILQDADVLCITGDESNHRSSHINHKEFLDFYSWLKKIRGKFKHVIMIPGNHSSWIFYNEREAKQMLKEIDVYLLIREEIVIDGIKFYGEPIVPTFGDWVYMTARHKLNKYWELIPEDVDVLLTHTPPQGVLDLSLNRNRDIEMCGCGALNKKVKKLKQLKAHLFGHIHNNKHIENTGLLQRGNVIFSNATAVTDGKISEGITFHGSLINLKNKTMNKEQLINNIASLADKWEGLTINKQENKVFEEYNELLEAKESGDIEDIKEELADVIITMVVLTKLQDNNLLAWVIVLDEIGEGFYNDFDFQDSVFEYFIFNIDRTVTEYNLNIWECLEYKYNIVAKREGKVINGTFVKNKQ